MCASVCPTGALTFGTYEDDRAAAPYKPVNVHVFGNQQVETKVYLMLPTDADEVKVDGCGVFEGQLELAAGDGCRERIVDRYASRRIRQEQ